MVNELRDILLSIHRCHIEDWSGVASIGMDLEDINFEEDEEEVSFSSKDKHYEFMVEAIESWCWVDEKGDKILRIAMPNRLIEISSINC